MAASPLSVDQEEALSKMRVGCILNGGVGSGKSRTGLAFYYVQNGGRINTDHYIRMTNPQDLYIITTARKRDTGEWEGELANFMLTPDPKRSIYKHKIVIDSWNNIHKYTDVKNAFFIFDEQRVVGYGTWTKSFLKIAASNKWILLSATPGDCWMDYIPVFIANGFYKNKTDFIRRHVVFSRFTPYPKPEKYINEGLLLKLRNLILVNIKFERNTIQHHIEVVCDYNSSDYDYVVRNRWDIYKDQPIENAAEYCGILSRIVNSSYDRQLKLLDIVKKRKKVIIFYSYDYEVELLRKLFKDTYTMAEWSGHKHEPLPATDSWVYLIQYTAGCEGWNCITTDTIVFYSQNYSYKKMVQAAGRIDRRNTPFRDLYYYHLKSLSKIDKTIFKALQRKRDFNIKGFAPDFTKPAPEKKDTLPEPIQLSLFDDEVVPVKYYGKNDPEKAAKKFEDYCEVYNSWEHTDPQDFEKFIKGEK